MFVLRLVVRCFLLCRTAAAPPGDDVRAKLPTRGRSQNAEYTRTTRVFCDTPDKFHARCTNYARLISRTTLWCNDNCVYVLAVPTAVCIRVYIAWTVGGGAVRRKNYDGSRGNAYL